jgi:hypothetical protein
MQAPPPLQEHPASRTYQMNWRRAELFVDGMRVLGSISSRASVSLAATVIFPPERESCGCVPITPPEQRARSPLRSRATPINRTSSFLAARFYALLTLAPLPRRFRLAAQTRALDGAPVCITDKPAPDPATPGNRRASARWPSRWGEPFEFNGGARQELPAVGNNWWTGCAVRTFRRASGVFMGVREDRASRARPAEMDEHHSRP